MDERRASALASVLARLAEALAGEVVLERLLPQIVTAAREATGARYAALGVLAEHSDVITRFVHEGMDPATVRAIGPTPTGGGLLGELIRHPHLIISDHLGAHPASRGFPAHHPPMETFLGMPVRAGGRVFGNLYLTDKPGGFDADDADVVTVLAAQAGLAVNAAQMAEELRAVAVQDERDRISRDLHDGVIQTLFSVGMQLEGARPLVRTDPERIEARIDAAVDSLDETIRRIRSTIFTLRPGRDAPEGLEDGLVRLAAEYEAADAVSASLQLGSALDQHVPAEVVPDVLHVVHEALSNAARHSGAPVVHVAAHVDRDVLVVRVDDAGKGFRPGEDGAGHGLANMVERAELLGAELVVDAAPGAGTRVDLRVPLDRSAGGA